MKRVPIKRGASSFSFPTGIPLSPLLTLSRGVVDYVQRRVCPSWDGRHRHTDASKRMQGRVHGRKPRRFGYASSLLHSLSCCSHRSHVFFFVFSILSSLPGPPRTLGCHRACEKSIAGTSPFSRFSTPPPSKKKKRKEKKRKKENRLFCADNARILRHDELICSFCLYPIRKTVRRGYAASVHAWNKSCVPSARSTKPVSRVRSPPSLSSPRLIPNAHMFDFYIHSSPG